MSAPLSDHDLAAGLVRDAGTLAAQMLTGGLATEYKSSISDVVSAADRAAEELIVTRLRAERPADGIEGEEGTRAPGARVWHVDPVDGTYNFLSGIPFWCSAIALHQAGTTLLGAVYRPASDELWLGGPGMPCTCNGAEVPGVVQAPLADISVATYLHPPRMQDEMLRVPLLRVVAAAATVRMLGCGSVELAAVAAGRIGAWVQPDTPTWDWFPGAALVRAAGGTTQVVVHGGHRWHIAGGRRAVTEIVRLLTLGSM